MIRTTLRLDRSELSERQRKMLCMDLHSKQLLVLFHCVAPPLLRDVVCDGVVLVAVDALHEHQHAVELEREKKIKFLER